MFLFTPMIIKGFKSLEHFIDTISANILVSKFWNIGIDNGCD